jgi:Tol biopolymer transport system component
VFLHDLRTQTTTLISLSPTGANGDSGAPAVSGDGRFVAFASTASNLVEGDTNEISDIFVYEAPRLR